MPPVTLVMIVKNEAETIEETLVSVRDYIDSWCILDTGSTDGTQELIQKTLEGVTGKLFFETFVDFSTSRNRVCELAAQHFEGFQLMLSGTEVFSGPVPEAFRNILAVFDTAQSPPSAYNVPILFGTNVRYPSIRLFKSNLGWRYIGRTHEVLIGPWHGLNPTPLGSCQIHYKGKPGGEDKTKRWEHDIELLKLDMIDRPEDPRPVFYLAQTFKCLGRKQEAIDIYARRLAMGGYQEELFISALYMGRLSKELGRTDKAFEYFEKACVLNPRRAEALFELALFHHHLGNYRVAYSLAREAWGKIPPPDALFVEKDVYEYRSADLVASHAATFQDMAIGAVAAEQAAKNAPWDKRIQANAAWYEDH